MINFVLRKLEQTLDELKREADLKFEGLLVGPLPKLIDYEQLLPGDVLFCAKDPKRLKHRIICEATSGSYAHCAIYVGNGLIAEVGNGGAKISSMEQLLKIYPYLVATRCPGNDSFQNRRKKIIEFCYNATKNKIRTYNLLGAASLPFREIYDLCQLRKIKRPSTWLTKKRFRKNIQFCSEFIVNAYINCGYINQDNAYLMAHRMSPNLLAAANVFEFIGYMSENGWDGICSDDYFLGGNSWVLKKCKDKKTKT